MTRRVTIKQMGLDTRTPADGRPAPKGAGQSNAHAPAADFANVPIFFERSSDRVFLGVAGGIGERMGVESLFVRIGFVLLAGAGGAGLVLYVVALAIAQLQSDGLPTGETVSRPVTRRHTVGFALIIAGLLIALRTLSIWFTDTLMWPLSLAAVGSSVIFLRDDRDDARWSANPLSGVFGPRPSAVRLTVGLALIAVGVASFLAANQSLVLARTAVTAMAATAAGIVFILGPWLSRLARQLVDERRQRIRSEERAEFGAHLHDSVLHTLALIQRSESGPEMVALARRQERELRSWLHGTSASSSTTIVGALDEMVSRVEEQHTIRVEVVTVSDCPIDENTSALVAAAQEATINAARHSGAAKVAVYCEVEPTVVNLYVRDQGKGFDMGAIDNDRRGIAESIKGRMRRHGGTASITSTSEGTEVVLRLPRTAQ